MVTWRQLPHLTSSESLSLCCFHCFQVNLVPEITQIIHTTVPDTFLHISDTFLLNLYFTGMV